VDRNGFSKVGTRHSKIGKRVDSDSSGSTLFCCLAVFATTAALVAWRTVAQPL